MSIGCTSSSLHELSSDALYVHVCAFTEVPIFLGSINIHIIQSMHSLQNAPSQKTRNMCVQVKVASSKNRLFSLAPLPKSVHFFPQLLSKLWTALLLASLMITLHILTDDSDKTTTAPSFLSTTTLFLSFNRKRAKAAQQHTEKV